MLKKFNNSPKIFSIITILISVLILNFSFIENSFAKNFFNNLKLNNQKYSDVNTWLKDQTVIRVYDDGAPGFGNQAATINAIYRLRELGFKGKFEFIYHTKPNKISILFNLPTSIPENYYDKEKNILFLTYGEYYKLIKDNNLQPITLALVGGGDSLAYCIKEEGISIPWDDEIFPYDNDAYMLNAKVAIQLTPWMANDCNAPTRIFLPNKKASEVFCKNAQQFFTMPVASFSQAKEYLITNPDGKRLLQEKPGLKTLMDNIENQNINVWFLYGQTLHKKSERDIGPLLGIIAAARYAQLHGSAQLQKPLVIPIFYDVQNKIKEINDLINGKNWNQYHFAGKENAKQTIEKLHLSTVFQIANITDADINAKIFNLKPNQILLLSVGPLPKIMFDGIYNFSAKNSWPQVREGQNTFSTLILTGKPHIRIQGAEIFWEPTDAGFGPDVFDTTHTLSKKYNNFIFADDTFWKEFQPEIMLGNFIIDSQDSSSLLSQYFAWLKTQALKPENDRVYSALEEAMHMIGK